MGTNFPSRMFQRSLKNDQRYILASAAGKENPRIWDLRKLSCVKEIETEGKTTNAIKFDLSGQYCAFGGQYLS